MFVFVYVNMDASVLQVVFGGQRAASLHIRNKDSLFFLLHVPGSLTGVHPGSASNTHVRALSLQPHASCVWTDVGLGDPNSDLCAYAASTAPSPNVLYFMHLLFHRKHKSAV